MTTGLELARAGSVARLTFTRPDKHNAISFDMWSAIPGIVAEVEADPAVTALVITGQGDNFSAGADIAEFGELRSTADGAALYDKAVHAAVTALADMVTPSIALIRGNCIGGGCQISVACDFRFAAEGARFGITPAKLGIIYDYPSTHQLVSLVGPANARYILLSAKLVGADRAHAMGLVNDVYPDGGLDAAVEDFVATLATRSQTSVRGMNRIIGKIAAGQDEPDAEVDQLRRDAIHGADYAEGVAAFLERRTPRFTHHH
ncbi:enoyl-CoA hydratase-related protein [Haloechinothrix halophila]|uniref:enoyl-CoA hydratase-related protein n=1 Tax=Haloechinothrix halophila TaxID=1069073 RepID=UPI0005559AA9|nr:enoyl-CoA hydratase-related protein [Haloechinothrix halophila]